MNNKPENEVKSSSNWGEDIDRAMRQIEIPAAKTKSALKRSHLVPIWALYLSIFLLVIIVLFRAPSYDAPHPIAEERKSEMGPRVALLMLAEELERYRLQHGQLPKVLPGALGNVLEVEYKKLNNHKFELHMASSEGRLVLRDNSSTITVL